ncbi:MAG: hypothetical protein IJB19_02310 [Clostridia bacterium]|nr:hypothetical protein [Clostridia bacterium]
MIGGRNEKSIAFLSVFLLPVCLTVGAFAAETALHNLQNTAFDNPTISVFA